MVVHIVLFKWKDGTPPDAVAEVRGALLGLKSQIGGIASITCGENFSVRSQGFQTGLVVEFADRAALDAYGPHPAHQAIVQGLISPISEAVLAVDYEA